MSSYRVTAWRDRHGEIWEQLGHSGAWSADGAADAYETVEALAAAEGPLTAHDVDDVAALLAENTELRRNLEYAKNTQNGRCRWCSAVVDPNHPRAPKRPGMRPVEAQPHRMDCRLYVGPLEHRWVNERINGTFGGIDYDCVCGGWFRQGGLAGHGDGSETAEPVCPNADQTWRGPR